VQLGRRAVVVVVWAASFELLSRYGVDILPRGIARQLTLEAYLGVVHVVTIAVGIGATAVLVSHSRDALGLSLPSKRAMGFVLGLAPAIFVTVTATAFLVARPTLLEELVQGGAALVQKSTGEFGRELTSSSALLAFLWGAVLSPVSEELFFRGALFGLVEELFARVVPKVSAPAAVLLIAIFFGVLHHDMPGGLGIVRFVSALGLGLACGIARALAGSVLAPLLLHVLFNSLSLATVRRWVVTESFPMKYGAPTLVGFFGLLLVVTVVAGSLAVRTHERADPSE
jgi:membrane protease YdiL (CAAX protease family)